MKTFKFLFLSFFVFLFSCGVNKNTVQEDLTLRQRISDRNYVFFANYVVPGGLSPRKLSPGYFLSVTKESVVANLPYYGNTNSTNYDYGKMGGYDFKSTNFDYKIKPGKKLGSWLVDINIKDFKDFITITVDINEKQISRMNFKSYSKESITYTGYVQ